MCQSYLTTRHDKQYMLSFTNMPMKINQLSIDVKVLMISFPRLSCLVLSGGHVTFHKKNYITKCDWIGMLKRFNCLSQRSLGNQQNSDGCFSEFCWSGRPLASRVLKLGKKHFKTILPILPHYHAERSHEIASCKQLDPCFGDALKKRSCEQPHGWSAFVSQC